MQCKKTGLSLPHLTPFLLNWYKLSDYLHLAGIAIALELESNNINFMQNTELISIQNHGVGCHSLTGTENGRRVKCELNFK